MVMWNWSNFTNYGPSNGAQPVCHKVNHDELKITHKVTSNFFQRHLALAGTVCSLLNCSALGSLAQNAPPEPPPVHYGNTAFKPGAVWFDDQDVPINAHGG